MEELRENSGPAQIARRKAAQYVRMSTEHQKYSTENQGDALLRYANERGFEIVRTYEDSGKSGLSIGGRDQLRHLIADVQSGQADFSAILVYDVSRWGRFQDADESAYYEFNLQRGRHRRPLLRRAVRKRRKSKLDHYQEHEARDGWRVQPRAIREGIRRAVPTHRSWVSPRRNGGLRIASAAG